MEHMSWVYGCRLRFFASPSTLHRAVSSLPLVFLRPKNTPSRKLSVSSQERPSRSPARPSIPDGAPQAPPGGGRRGASRCGHHRARPPSGDGVRPRGDHWGFRGVTAARDRVSGSHSCPPPPLPPGSRVAAGNRRCSRPALRVQVLSRTRRLCPNPLPPTRRECPARPTCHCCLLACCVMPPPLVAQPPPPTDTLALAPPPAAALHPPSESSDAARRRKGHCEEEQHAQGAPPAGPQLPAGARRRRQAGEGQRGSRGLHGAGSLRLGPVSVWRLTRGPSRPLLPPTNRVRWRRWTARTPSCTLSSPKGGTSCLVSRRLGGAGRLGGWRWRWPAFGGQA